MGVLRNIDGYIVLFVAWREDFFDFEFDPDGLDTEKKKIWWKGIVLNFKMNEIDIYKSVVKIDD